MSTHADKIQENKSQSVENEAPQKQNSDGSTFHFVDNRHEAVAQRKLQEGAENSSRVKQLKTFHEKVNNSPQAKKAAQLQSNANDHSVRQQHPVQKKDNNTGLPDNLKSGVEHLSGYAMDDVKVHYNSDKPAQLQAHAYAQGTDIHLAPGQEKHLPHEAWHVVQQKKGIVKPTMQMKGGLNVNDDQRLEREADVMGEKAISVGKTGVGGKEGDLQNTSVSHGATHQYKSRAIEGDGVVQRAVNTWGGTFTEGPFEAKTEKFMSDRLIGAYMKLMFTPNANCPRDVAIGLIQIVRINNAGGENAGLAKVLKPTKQWAIDRQNDANPVYGSYDTETGGKSKELTDNPPVIKKERAGLMDRTLIDTGAQLGKKQKRSATPAILTDDPRVDLVKGEQSQLFETTAMVLEGPAKGLALGTVSWGWKKADGSSEPELLGPALVKNSGSSDNLTAARDVWNEHADKHGLVPLPAIKDSTQAPGGGGGKCYITTACTQYMGLEDDCDELTTLRTFRDQYLLQQENGSELVSRYYDHAPDILATIRNRDDWEEILKKLYRIIRLCVEAIKKGNNRFAFDTYCKMVIELKKKYGADE